MTASTRRMLVLVWGLSVLFVFWLYSRDVAKLDGLFIDGRQLWGRDFINVWTAGHIQRAGRLSILYDVSAYQAFQSALVGIDLDPLNYSYPPLGLPLTIPFAMLPYPTALALWLIATGALFAVAARPWLRDAGLPTILAVLTPAALVNIWAGHYGFLIGALWLFGWRAMQEGHSRPAGIWFGLMAVKPHLALLIPIVLLCRRQWSAIMWAGVTVAALVLLSLALYGPRLWIDYLTTTSRQQADLIDAGLTLFAAMSTSATTAVLRVGGSFTIAGIFQIACALAALGMTIHAALRPGPIDRVALLAATATFLILPYAFVYDLTVVSLAALILLAQTPDGRSRLLILGGFSAAALGFALSVFFRFPATPLMLLGFAVVQYRLIVRSPAAPAGAVAAH